MCQTALMVAEWTCSGGTLAAHCMLCIAQNTLVIQNCTCILHNTKDTAQVDTGGHNRGVVAGHWTLDIGYLLHTAYHALRVLYCTLCTQTYTLATVTVHKWTLGEP